jgi:hypothetical protein
MIKGKVSPAESPVSTYGAVCTTRGGRVKEVLRKLEWESAFVEGYDYSDPDDRHPLEAGITFTLADGEPAFDLDICDETQVIAGARLTVEQTERLLENAWKLLGKVKEAISSPAGEG